MIPFVMNVFDTGFHVHPLKMLACSELSDADKYMRNETMAIMVDQSIKSPQMPNLHKDLLFELSFQSGGG